MVRPQLIIGRYNDRAKFRCNVGKVSDVCVSDSSACQVVSPIIYRDPYMAGNPFNNNLVGCERQNGEKQF